MRKPKAYNIPGLPVLKLDTVHDFRQMKQHCCNRSSIKDSANMKRNGRRGSAETVNKVQRPSNRVSVPFGRDNPSLLDIIFPIFAWVSEVRK